MTDKTFPTPEEIQKEFEDFVQKRFGGSVTVVAQKLPLAPGPHQARPERAAPPPPRPLDAKNFRFDYKPRDLKEYLDRFVIRQDEAKKALAIAVCDHYNHVLQTIDNPAASEQYAKQNVLLLGPTGVGKTYLVRQLAKLIGVPFVKADATKFSETGYVGANVEDVIRDLVAQADGDIQRAQFGIVYLDEADKLAASSSPSGRDVSGRGVQIGLLKLMEETEVELTGGNDMRSQIQMLIEAQKQGKIERKIINTRHILFIVSGAFQGLAEIVQKRLGREMIGFHRSASEGGTKERDANVHELLAQASTKDFVEYGFEPEFAGRLPVRVPCHTLNENDLLAVLKSSEGSVLRQYEAAFRAYGIDVIFTDAALKLLAHRAAEESTGARALLTIFEGLLRDFKFELPSSSVKEFVVNEDAVRDPQTVLKALLAAPASRQFELEVHHIRKFEQDYFREHGVSVHFDAEATRAAYEAATARGIKARDLCAELLSNWEYGLKLIRQTTGRNSFTLGADVVHDPKAGLERLVVGSYQPQSNTTTSEPVIH